MKTIILNKNIYPILFLLILASALRFYNVFNLEYTYDELSALNRLQYGSISEVIELGVKKLDTHPALIQVLLYYYCLLFGTSEWVVKIPFIIAGIASIYVIFIIGKKWFNETVGLLTAAILCCAQFFIFYSVTARPYISGLLLSLLALRYLLDVLFIELPKTKHYILLSLFLALCALNHHFSMMFAALCGIVGLFFTTKNNRKYFIFSCIGAVVIYSPHFSILFYQLKTGGIGTKNGGWLNPPENRFILDFLLYIFHYSYLFALAFVSIIGLTIFISNQKKYTTQQNKIRILFFLLFALSFLIGFFYSQKVNPVIQYSTLIFVTPCLLLFFSSFAYEVNYLAKWGCIILLVAIGLYTLVIKRRYYELIFNQPFDTFIKTADKVTKQKGVKNVFGLFKGEQWFLDYYKKKYNSKTNYKVIENESLSAENYKSIYDTLQSQYIVLGDFNAAQLLQASIYFPYVYKKIIGYNFDIYVLSKEKYSKNLDKDKKYIVSTNFKLIPPLFNYNKNLIQFNDGKYYYRVDSLNEFPISYKIKNKYLNLKEGQTILAEITYTSNKKINGILCASTDANGKNVHWASKNLIDYYNSKSTTQKVYVSIYVDSKFNYTDNELNIFIWNDHKEIFKISNFSIYRWDNNPYRYGLLSNF